MTPDYQRQISPTIRLTDLEMESQVFLCMGHSHIYPKFMINEFVYIDGALKSGYIFLPYLHCQLYKKIKP